MWFPGGAQEQACKSNKKDKWGQKADSQKPKGGQPLKAKQNVGVVAEGTQEHRVRCKSLEKLQTEVELVSLFSRKPHLFRDVQYNT